MIKAGAIPGYIQTLAMKMQMANAVNAQYQMIPQIAIPAQLTLPHPLTHTRTATYEIPLKSNRSPFEDLPSFRDGESKRPRYNDQQSIHDSERGRPQLNNRRSLSPEAYNPHERDLVTRITGGPPEGRIFDSQNRDPFEEGGESRFNPDSKGWVNNPGHADHKNHRCNSWAWSIM